jgi:hypothetical protein
MYDGQLKKAIREAVQKCSIKIGLWAMDNDLMSQDQKQDLACGCVKNLDNFVAVVNHPKFGSSINCSFLLELAITNENDLLFDTMVSHPNFYKDKLEEVMLMSDFVSQINECRIAKIETLIGTNWTNHKNFLEFFMSSDNKCNCLNVFLCTPSIRSKLDQIFFNEVLLAIANNSRSWTGTNHIFNKLISTHDYSPEILKNVIEICSKKWYSHKSFDLIKVIVDSGKLDMDDHFGLVEYLMKNECIRILNIVLPKLKNQNNILKVLSWFCDFKQKLESSNFAQKTKSIDQEKWKEGLRKYFS